MKKTDHTFVIAEAGVNHDGDLKKAEALVRAAADAGADAVKFQTFSADAVVQRGAPKAAYQNRTGREDADQHAMLARLELPMAAFHRLKKLAERQGLVFMSTPFDLSSFEVLNTELNVQRHKVASGEITNAPLLFAMARSGKPIVLSTGMATMEDIRNALGVLACSYMGCGRPSVQAFRAAFTSDAGQQALKKNVTLLQCTSAYPTPPSDIHLRAMDTLTAAFDLPVGLSDHSAGTSIALGAVGRGSVVIEKHFTLNRGDPGPDHAASLEPDDLAAMIRGIRDIERALGDGTKQVRSSEADTWQTARKSLVALTPIAAGERFTPQNLGLKRPGGGLSPLHYYDILWTKAARHYAADERIETP